ncbi:HTH domain-containing protein [Providencia rettgeri]|uniref:helix-turn-helix domain-containing protein n=1 Tax=Providencia rettgeri TaxID=587 RepID=UPI000D9DFC3F|nr:helix-turn-helix domain-containing protein [Providencia rettgeri]EIU9517415.1 HTH domain-containing protein [Providencia rettgeri]PYZ51338.1 plasmid replication protein [Providencia rettgeri]
MKENKKRTKTAKELAEKTGLSTRTIYRYFAQDREDYEQEALNRRKTAYELRERGLSWKEVAEAMQCSYNAVTSLAKRYKQQDLKESI